MIVIVTITFLTSTTYLVGEACLGPGYRVSNRVRSRFYNREDEKAFEDWLN